MGTDFNRGVASGIFNQFRAFSLIKSKANFFPYAFHLCILYSSDLGIFTIETWQKSFKTVFSRKWLNIAQRLSFWITTAAGVCHWLTICLCMDIQHWITFQSRIQIRISFILFSFSYSEELRTTWPCNSTHVGNNSILRINLRIKNLECRNTSQKKDQHPRACIRFAIGGENYSELRKKMSFGGPNTEPFNQWPVAVSFKL